MQFTTLFLIMTLICTALPAQDDREPANESIKRWNNIHEQLVKKRLFPAKQLHPDLTVLPEAWSGLARKLVVVDTEKPWLLDWPASEQAEIPGSIRYEMSDKPGHAILVVQDDLAELSDLEFLSAMRYLGTLHQLAREIDAAPGPLFRGLAVILSNGLTYPTRLAWSSEEIEAAAAVYLLQLLNDGQPIDLTSLHLADPERNANLPEFRDHVKKLLSRINAAEAVTNLLEDRFVERTNSADAELPPELVPFVLAAVLAPLQQGILDKDKSLPDEQRNLIQTKVIDPLLNTPDRYQYLPARFRLLRVARTVAHGRDAVRIARVDAGLPLAEKREVETAREMIQSVRKKARKLLDDEAHLRGGTKDRPPLVWSADQTMLDPQSAVELCALLLSDSVVWAAKVRVHSAESYNSLTDEQLRQAITEAFNADQELADFFARYGTPDIEIESSPASQVGRSLQLVWKVNTPVRPNQPSKHLGTMKLNMVDSFSRGGDGLPISPAILGEQIVLARPDGKAAPTRLELSTVAVHHFVEASVKFQPAEPLPEINRRLFQLIARKPLDSNEIITITAAGVEFAGTASQKILARRLESDAWGWLTIGSLRPGNEAFMIDRGAVKVTGAKQTRGKASFVSLTIAGTDHLNADGFLAYCAHEEIKNDSKHGVVVGYTTVENKNPGADDAAVALEARVPVTKVRNPEHFESVELLSLVDKISWPKREFVKIRGFLSDAELVGVPDQIVGLAPDATNAIWRINYTINKVLGTVAVSQSSGFLVRRDVDPLSTVPAHELRPGDELYTSADPDAPFARVTTIAVEVSENVENWKLINPEVLRGEWLQINGVILHALRSGDQPGVHGTTRMAAVDVQPGSEASFGIRIGQDVHIQNLSVHVAPIGQPDETPAGQLSEATGHALIAADVGADSAASGRPTFRARTVGAVRRTVVPGVFRIDTEDRHRLFVSAATGMWRHKGDPFSQEVRQVVESVTAREIGVGDRVVIMGNNAGAPVLSLSRVAAKVWIDAIDGIDGSEFFEIWRVEFSRSPIPVIHQNESHYQDLFGNGIAVNFGKPLHEEDRWPSGGGKGGPGSDPGLRLGTTVGATHESAKIEENPVYKAAFGLPGSPQKVDPLQFSEADRVIFDGSFSRLMLLMDEAAGDLKPPTNPKTLQRLTKFVATTMGIEVNELCHPDTLQEAFALYTDTRADLLQSGAPSLLGDLSRTGVVLSYALEASGGPGRELLEDLLTIQLRIALNPDRGSGAWKNQGLWCRDSVLFAMEFPELNFERLPVSATGVSRFRRTQWTGAHTWIDLLLNRTVKDINPDVIQETDDGNQTVLLYNLVLQMDQVTGQPKPLDGLCFPELNPDVDSDKLFTGLARRLSDKGGN